MRGAARREPTGGARLWMGLVERGGRLPVLFSKVCLVEVKPLIPPTRNDLEMDGLGGRTGSNS
jgi:hypothetical protein